MRVNYVNPFVSSVFSVLDRVAGVKGVKGRLSVKETPHFTQDVVSVIGVMGMLRGQVHVGMTWDTATRLSGKMLKGIKVADMEEMTLSSVGELSNIITGNAGILLSRQGYSCMISPPLIISGSSMKVSTLDLKTIVIPIETDLGLVELDIALEETLPELRIAERELAMAAS